MLASKLHESVRVVWLLYRLLYGSFVPLHKRLNSNQIEMRWQQIYTQN